MHGPAPRALGAQGIRHCTLHIVQGVRCAVRLRRARAEGILTSLCHFFACLCACDLRSLCEASAAEYDHAAAECYKREVEAKISMLEFQQAQLTGKDRKKERSAKGKEAAELRNEQRYVDACKVVKGLEPKFGHFVTKAAVVPEAVKAPEEVKAPAAVSRRRLREVGLE